MAKRGQALRRERAVRKPAKPRVDLKQKIVGLERELAQEREQRAATIAKSSKPSIDLLLATETTKLPPEISMIEYLHREDRARPGGRRFGALVHAALRDVELIANRKQIERVVTMHGRVLGAPAEETSAASEAVNAALQHAILKRAIMGVWALDQRQTSRSLSVRDRLPLEPPRRL